jgi:hypothetical protein
MEPMIWRMWDICRSRNRAYAPATVNTIRATIVHIEDATSKLSCHHVPRCATAPVQRTATEKGPVKFTLALSHRQIMVCWRTTEVIQSVTVKF